MNVYYLENDGTKILYPDTITYYLVQEKSVNLIYERKQINMESVIPILVFLLGILLTSIIAKSALSDEKKLADKIERSNKSIDADFEKVKLTISTGSQEHIIAIRRLIMAFCTKHKSNHELLIQKRQELENLFKEKYNDTIF